MDINLADLGFDTNFSTPDWCIVIGYLIAIVSIGVYIRKYIASATDFMVAGRGLKTFLAIATMGGFNTWAKKSDVRVLRSSDEGIISYRFNFGAYVAGKAPDSNMILLPGDTVVVPD